MIASGLPTNTIAAQFLTLFKTNIITKLANLRYLLRYYSKIS